MFNTSVLPDSLIAQNAAACPLISGLRQFEMNALLKLDNSESSAQPSIGLIPAERTTSDMLAYARQHARAIADEILTLKRAFEVDNSSFAKSAAIVADVTSRKESAENAAENAVGNAPIRSRWADPRHYVDPDGTEHYRLSDTFDRLFAYLNHIGAPGHAYYNGDEDGKPARPYCYVKPVLQNGKYDYLIMLAEVDNADYVWADAEQFDFIGHIQAKRGARL